MMPRSAGPDPITQAMMGRVGPYTLQAMNHTPLTPPASFQPGKGSHQLACASAGYENSRRLSEAAHAAHRRGEAMQALAQEQIAEANWQAEAEELIAWELDILEAQARNAALQEEEVLARQGRAPTRA